MDPGTVTTRGYERPHPTRKLKHDQRSGSAGRGPNARAPVDRPVRATTVQHRLRAVDVNDFEPPTPGARQRREIAALWPNGRPAPRARSRAGGQLPAIRLNLRHTVAKSYLPMDGSTRWINSGIPLRERPVLEIAPRLRPLRSLCIARPSCVGDATHRTSVRPVHAGGARRWCTHGLSTAFVSDGPA